MPKLADVFNSEQGLCDLFRCTGPLEVAASDEVLVSNEHSNILKRTFAHHSSNTYAVARLGEAIEAEEDEAISLVLFEYFDTAAYRFNTAFPIL